VSSSEEAIPEFHSCSGCDELLDVSTFGPLETAVCPKCKAETTVKSTFGSYTLKSRYAIGGMSVVFVAQDNTLNRGVAIKVLNEDYSVNETRVAAFENEARLTAAVNHPNVIDVYTVGRAYGRFYLVMELLKGKSFERIMSKRGALPEKEVIDIALQVAAGLQAAKQSGMIHRDVKPGNILVDKNGHAKLLDFGLALITQGGSAQAEEIWATPFYTPPEALERGNEDFRSDIYAFGATLYHALAGRPPFETTSTSNKVLRRAKQTIPRLTKVADWISPATGEAIDRMMAYKPKDRWSSYPEVIEALEYARRNVEKNATSPVHGDNRRKRRRKRGKLIPVLGILSGLAAIGGALAVWKPWNSNEKKNTLATPPKPPVAIKSWEPAAVGDQDRNDRLVKALKEARSLVGEKKFPDSEASFDKLATDISLPDSTRAWAALEAAVSAYFDARSQDAKSHATKLVPYLKSDKDSDDVKDSLLQISMVLRRPEPPSIEQFPEDLNNIINRMGTLALTLKMWEQGKWKDAVPFLQRIQSLPLEENFEWFKIYQTIAGLYLEDAETYAEVLDLPPVTSPEIATEQVGVLNAAQKKLHFKSRLRYNIRARQAYLLRIKKGLESRPSEKVILDWSVTLKQVAEKTAVSRFNEALTLIKENAEKAPKNGLWAWSFLTEQSIGFIDDLKKMENWEVRSKEGITLKPTGANVLGIILENNKTLEYRELDPTSLIRAHTIAREGLEPAENRFRLVHAIAYAWQIGLTDDAESQAEQLAETDEQFRSDWKRVIVGLSEE